MRKIVSIISVLMLLLGSALYISSCTEEVNPFEDFQMPTEADTNSRYLVCEIDGRLYFARNKVKKRGTYTAGGTLESIMTQWGRSADNKNKPIDALFCSEDFEINNEIVSEFIGFYFYPLLARDSAFGITTVPLGKASGGETPMCAAAFIRAINKDSDHPRSVPLTQTSEIEKGEIVFSTIGSFDDYPIYHGTFWFDVKNPKTGEIIKIRNGRFNHNISINFPDKYYGGFNSIAY